MKDSKNTVTMTQALAPEKTASYNQALAGGTVAAGIAAFKSIRPHGLGKASIAATVATLAVGTAAAYASSWVNRSQKDSNQQGHQR